ncbi:MAG: 2-aminophenol 1,6-dioxygenase subunit beta [Candidatus Heimdallarchaeota archaeon LC_3]|nr:MAG: 2-aminophenol 1,6-dioxygenase subunit beta [Candidatus Heimdallarchaeota archaeon LC_3]
MNESIKGLLLPHIPYLLPELGLSKIEAKIKKLLNTINEVKNLIECDPPEAFLICSPHFEGEAFSIGLQKLFIGDLGPFQRQDVIDQRLCHNELANAILEDGLESGYLAPISEDQTPSNRIDYGSIVALRLIDPKAKIRIVPISVSSGNLIEHYRWGQKLKSVVDKLNKRVIFIASTELSQEFNDIPNALPSEFLQKYDREVISNLVNQNIDKLLKLPKNYLRYTEKDLRPMYTLAGYSTSYQGELMDYSGFIGCGCAVMKFI